jgi:hypothetical protein
MDGLAAGLHAVVERPDMTPLSAWRDGIRRVASAPLILIGVWLMTILVSVPLTVALHSEVRNHLGDSLAAETAASGVNYEWMQEFADQASALGATLRPTVLGFGAVLDNLSAFVDRTSRPLVIVGAVGTYIVLWLFVTGGIIDRYARDRTTSAHGFFSASGVFFFRFLRLAIVMFAVYGLLFGYLHPWLFGTAYSRLIREVNVERTAFFIRGGLYLLFGLIVAACNLVFDYAKVRAVVEDRRSAVGALLSAVRFVRDNLSATVGLYLVNIALFALTLAVYAAVAPGAGGTGLTMWIGFAISQLYILARLCVKVVFWSSETALFQSRLAHAGYVAAPDREWPESPSVEALQA